MKIFHNTKFNVKKSICLLFAIFVLVSLFQANVFASREVDFRGRVNILRSDSAPYEDYAIGETLTADFTNDGEMPEVFLTYQWIMIDRNNRLVYIPGQTSKTLLVLDDYSGYRITVKIGSTTQPDKYLTPLVESSRVEKRDSVMPTSVTITEVTQTVVKVRSYSDEEYVICKKNKVNGNWYMQGSYQSSGEFTGLDADSEYMVYARRAETDYAKASKARESKVVRTHPAYKITYDANGGTGTVRSDETVIGENLSFPYTYSQGMKLVAPTGKYFKGWALTKNASEVIKSHSFTSDATVYAVWMKPTGVNISPSKNVSVSRGTTKQFTADVLGENMSDDSVYWSILGNKDLETTINKDSGLLSVGRLEPSNEIKIVAKSKIDNNTKGMLDVQIGGEETDAQAVARAKSLIHSNCMTYIADGISDEKLRKLFQIQIDGQLSDTGVNATVVSATLNDGNYYDCVINISKGNVTDSINIAMNAVYGGEVQYSIMQSYILQVKGINFENPVDLNDYVSETSIKNHIKEIVNDEILSAGYNYTPEELEIDISVNTFNYKPAVVNTNQNLTDGVDGEYSFYIKIVFMDNTLISRIFTVSLPKRDIIASATETDAQAVARAKSLINSNCQTSLHNDMDEEGICKQFQIQIDSQLGDTGVSATVVSATLQEDNDYDCLVNISKGNVTDSINIAMKAAYGGDMQYGMMYNFMSTIRELNFENPVDPSDYSSETSLKKYIISLVNKELKDKKYFYMPEDIDIDVIIDTFDYDKTNKTYDFVVTLKYEDNLLSSRMKTISFSSAIAVPTITKANAIGTKLNIEWNKVSGATGYRVAIYNYTYKKYYYYETTNTNFQLNTAVGGRKYKVVVTSLYKKDGKETRTDYSTEKYITTEATQTKLVTPTITYAGLGDKGTELRVNWNAVEGATSYRLAIYNYTYNKWYYYNTTSTTKDLGTSVGGRNYKIKVRAINGVNDSAYTSNEDAKHITTLLTPTLTDLVLYPEDTTDFTATWNAVESATGYRVAVYNYTYKKWYYYNTTSTSKKIATGVGGRDYKVVVCATFTNDKGSVIRSDYSYPTIKYITTK